MSKYTGKLVDFRPELIPGLLTEDVIIGFNTKLWQVPRGKTSKVPDYIKGEYERGQRAQERLMATQESKRYKDPVEEAKQTKLG